MTDNDRVVLVRLDADRLQAELDSPTMRALLDKGYTPGPWWGLQLVRDGAPVIHLSMWPPSPPATPAPPRWWKVAAWSIVAMLAVIITLMVSLLMVLA